MICFACSKFWILNGPKWTRSSVWCQVTDWSLDINPTSTSQAVLISARVISSFGNPFFAYLWVNVENSETTKKHTAERPFYYLYFGLHRCSIHSGLSILSLQKYPITLCWDSTWTAPSFDFSIGLLFYSLIILLAPKVSKTS